LIILKEVYFAVIADVSSSIHAHSATMKWYSYGGHLEKRVIETKLLEVRYDNEEKELFEAV